MDFLSNLYFFMSDTDKFNSQTRKLFNVLCFQEVIIQCIVYSGLLYRMVTTSCTYSRLYILYTVHDKNFINTDQDFKYITSKYK